MDAQSSTLKRSDQCLLERDAHIADVLNICAVLEVGTGLVSEVAAEAPERCSDLRVLPQHPR
eukprot:scaffold60391_cov35-Tisochrysis_lutea.AAC.2